MARFVFAIILLCGFCDEAIARFVIVFQYSCFSSAMGYSSAVQMENNLIDKLIIDIKVWYLTLILQVSTVSSCYNVS